MVLALQVFYCLAECFNGMCVEFNDLSGSVFINRPGTVDIIVLVKLL